MENLILKTVKNPHLIKGGANGKGTKNTSQQTSMKPQLM